MKYIDSSFKGITRSKNYFIVQYEKTNQNYKKEFRKNKNQLKDQGI